MVGNNGSIPDYSNRLPRGSSYARKGAVVKIDIENNRINAKVSGSHTKPYKVNIILPPFAAGIGLNLTANSLRPLVEPRSGSAGNGQSLPNRAKE